MQMLVRIHHRYEARVVSFIFLHSAVVKSHTEGFPEEDRQSQVPASPVLWKFQRKDTLRNHLRL